MEDAQGGDRQRGLFRRVVHRGKKGVFLGSDVYPPPGVRVDGDGSAGDVSFTECVTPQEGR
jgi:hypothetical protein